MSAPTDFIVLTGFLGSGKTTLLSDFLAGGDDTQTAVIVNDVGEVNIDGAIIAVRSGVPMATLSNGCVCCSLTNDLLYTVEALIETGRLAGKAPFARIILECSGLSHPGAVLRSLGALSQLAMRVRVVATCPADRPAAAGDDFELAAAQLCAAHTIVLTRLDLAGAAAIERAAATARALGPMATVIVEPQRATRAALSLGPSGPTAVSCLPNGLDDTRMAATAGHPRVNVFALGCEQPIEWAGFSAWLENLAGYLEVRLLRVKGLLTVAGCGEQLLIQGVGQHFDTPCRIATGSRTSHLIVIARDTSREEVEAITPPLPSVRITMLRAPGAAPEAARLARPA